MLSNDIKQSLVKMLYTQFNISLETCLNYLGLNVQDEKAKRQKENDEGFDGIFKPRLTAFTNSGEGDGGDGGRPTDPNSKNPDKQLDDKLNKKKVK
jgi:hypothetical protein